MKSEELQPLMADAEKRRERIRQKTVQGLEGLFPIISRNYLLEAKNVAVASKNYSSNAQKKALLSGHTIHEAVKADLVLRDKKTGKVVDTQRQTLAHLPYFTQRHTFIVGGNEYDVPHQLRLKSGVYTRQRANGEYEAAFNLSKGMNFRLSMEPESGKFNMELGTSKIPLYSVLRALGVPNSEIKKHWGSDLSASNAASALTEEKALAKIIAKIKRRGDTVPGTVEGKRQFIRNYFYGTKMDAGVNARTLGMPVDRASDQALLAASAKLLKVQKGEEREDDRDSLEFKTIHSVDDFFKERLDVDARRSVVRKLEWKLNRAKTKKIQDIVPNSTFTKSLNTFITNSSLASTPMQINPVEIIDHASRVTSLGEGGISSERAIPFESRKVHNTHLGILDPVRTPECHSADTEVLTRTGWMLWPDVEETTEFGCRVGEELEWHTATNLTKAPYEGDLVLFKNGKVDLAVTPNHRMWTRPYDYNAAFRFELAGDLLEKTRQFDTQHAPYVGSGPRFYQLPHVEGNNSSINVGPIPIDTWARFMGWWLSEGCCVYNTETSTYHALITQSDVNPAECADIERVLEKMPFKWCRRQDQSYVIGVKQLAAYLHQFGKSQDKFIPPYLFDAPVSARQNLLEALLLGGGRINSNRATGRHYVQQVYCTTSPQLALDVERLAISLGYAVRTAVYSDDREERYLDTHEVRLMQHRWRAVFPKKGHVTSEHYAGMVYCAEVPGGLLLTRRNGSVPVWSGNSFKAGVDVRAAMSALRDDKGNLYTVMTDAQTGKRINVSATRLAGSTVAFPGQQGRKTLEAIKGDDVVSIDRKDVDYEMPDAAYMFSPATSMVPLLNGMQGNRAIMGSKFQTQALPLLSREAPYVQVKAPRSSQSMEREMARLVVPTSPVDGTVAKIDDDFIYVKPDKVKTGAAGDQLIKLPYDTFFPLQSKTYLHNDLKVKKGDKVRKDQMLADSNFTKDNAMALGKNMSVAYMAYYGKNSNDAVVISESASNKLTSEHMYKESLQKGPKIVLGKEKFKAYYPNKYTAAQLSKLDNKGVAKKDASFNYGDPLILGLEKAALTPEASLLGNFHKSLVKPYRDITVTWEHQSPGTVQDVMNAAKQVMLTLRTQEKMRVGDKLANRFGGKGVVSEIVPDEQMIQDEGKKPVDILFTSAGVISRINPSQIVESALGKVAEKTGKPVVLSHFQDQNNVTFAKKLLKKHGVKDKETVYDPISDKKIDNIFVGRSYIHKLFKSTDTNYAARGVTSYDANLQPTRGGSEGAKGLGKMEINGLLAHGARNVLQEAMTLKSEKSDDFWRAYELGQPTPPSQVPFATTKFTTMLEGAGINLDKRGSMVTALPMTDKDVLSRSTGALTIPSLDKSKSFMVRAKDLKPEKGGLFDPVITGGLTGTKWSHMDLSEPTVNPVFEEPVRRLLGLTKSQFRDMLKTEGGAGVKKRLAKIDLKSKKRELLQLTKTRKGAALDNAVKQLKYIKALDAGGFKNPGEAYVVSKVPVIPPVFRPILPSRKGGDLQIADSNKLYRDVGIASEVLKEVAATGLPTRTGEAREHVYDTLAALQGVAPPASPQLRAQQAKGFIETITGAGSPKSGFFHKKLLKRQQDLSGRATAAPDASLDLDQIGLPEEMLWTTYEKFIMRGLVTAGHRPVRAKEMIEQRHPQAKSILEHELKNRPVLVNRAPSLHKHNIVAAYPVAVQGKTIRVNPFIERGMNLDYDGDTLQIHTPITRKAVDEAKAMTLSKVLFSDKNRDDLMVFPQHEAIIGIYSATANTEKGATRKFKTKADAMAAYRRGDITMNTPVKIG